MSRFLDQYLEKYTSGHSAARKMQEMFNNPGKYSYNDFSSQLDKAKYIPKYDDYLGNYDDYEYAERQATKKYNTANSTYLGIRSNLLNDFAGRQQAPAPAPKPKAAPAPKPKLDALDNKYRKESETLLKKISDMEAQLDKVQRPKTIFAAPSAVSAGNLQIAPAAGINKMAGTSSFKRRTTSPSTSKVRTIQSLNV